MNLFSALILVLLSNALQLTAPLVWAPINLPLLVAVFIGLKRGNGMGLACGIAAGVMTDSLVSPVFGLYTLAGALAGGLADLLSNSFNREQIFTQSLSMAVLTLIHDLAVWQGAQWTGIHQISLERFMWAFAVPKVLTHALVAIPAFVVLKLFIRPRGSGRFTGVPKMIRTLPRRF